MRIDAKELETLTLIVAKGRFRGSVFGRRELMRLVEAVVKTLDLWSDEDDDESGSAGEKSRGMAAIDWAISHLKESGLLTHMAHNQWRVA